jgi:hypothetical protein
MNERIADLNERIASYTRNLQALEQEEPFTMDDGSLYPTVYIRQNRQIIHNLSVQLAAEWDSALEG